MRVRVRFTYNSLTGEVEVFQVDDAESGPRAPDHDARHDAATLDVARIVDPNPRVTEVPANTSTDVVARPRVEPVEPATPIEERRRE